MAVQNPPGFLQNAGTTHTAAQLRMYFAALQAGMSAGATSLRARGGVHPGLGQEFSVTQTGSPSMAVLVESGACSVPGSLSSTQGNYFVVNDAQVTSSVTAAHATLPRIDLVVVNVRDSFYSGASNDCQLQVIAGTPASSPVAPTAPDNSITIAQIAVAAAASSIVNANITDTRAYVAAVGGVINVRNTAALPASTEIVEGQLVWQMDTNKLLIWDGSAYEELFPTSWTTWTPTLTNLTQGSGAVTARYLKIGKTLQWRFKFVYGAGSAVGSQPRFTLPFTPHSSYNATQDILGKGTLLDGGTANNPAIARLVSGSTIEIFRETDTSHATINSGSPWTWTNDDSLSVSGTIELA